MKALHDGRYKATCKEATRGGGNELDTGLVFPEANCTVSKGHAIFDRDGVELWRCNAAYAEAHFKLERID